MAVRPSLLKLYERYFLPLQRSLLPSLQAFVMGLLPGLEEGLEVYDRTDALMVKLSLLVGQHLFYSALWSSILISPLLRLPATSFIVLHFDRMGSGHEQRYMLGSNHMLAMQAIYLALQDANVLVQRNTLEILLFFFPLSSCQDPAEACVPITQDDVVSIMSAASLTLLRRDLSLNRRMYAWLLGTDCKGGMVAPDPNISTTLECHGTFYFDKYSRDLLIQALINILEQKKTFTDAENVLEYLRPLRIIIILLEKPEIGTQVAGELMLEVIRALYRCCRGPITGGQGTRENRNMAELLKTMNVLISSLGTEYLWDYMSGQFHSCLSMGNSGDPSASAHTDRRSPPPRAPPSLSELSELITFLLDVIPLELYSEIQTHYLPQMLVRMLRALQGHMTTLSLSELTQGLNACLKVLTRIQTPAGCSGKTKEPQTLGEKGSQAQGGMEAQEKEEEEEEEEEEDQTAEEGLETTELTGEQEQKEQEKQEEEREEEQEVNSRCSALTPPPQADYSATDLVAPPSESTPGNPEEGLESCPKREDVWRRGGSMENMAKCVEDILASFIARHLLDVVGEEQEPGEAGDAKPPLGQTESQEPPLNPQPGGAAPDKQMQQDVDGPSGDREGWGAGRLDWRERLKARDGGRIPEACCRAFSVTCHLLLECTTFPLYLSEEEMEGLCACVFHSTGNVEDTLPLWLMSLMMCCLLKDHHIQHVAMSTMLELVDRSQSLLLVIEDKIRRYKSSKNNPFSGQLHMVTAPPLNPTLLTVMAQSTDFYQRVAQVLWGQLDTEQRELHVPTVELFYRLHCLAPSASICENIICQELIHKDKTVRLEALHRFSVLWHLTRETQTNVTMLLNRSFDRSLFVVLDNLNSPDGAISTAAQSWLIRVLSLNDVIRILEPVLLLLLHPTTQCSSIQWVKQNLTVDNLQQLSCRQWEFSGDFGRSAEAMATDGQSEESPLSHVTPVERAALWAEMESAPGTAKMVTESAEEDRFMGKGEEAEGEEQREEEKEEMRQERDQEVEEERESREHSELAESYSSSDSLSPVQPLDCDSSGDETPSIDLRRVDSAPTLGSEDEDLEQEAMAHLRLLKQEKEKREALESLFRHTLLYLQPHDSAPVCHALSVVEMLLRSCPAPFIQALCSTYIHPDSAHHRLICNLTQRHLQAQEGHSFYAPLLIPPVRPRPILLVELLTCLCLQFLRSFYPCYLHVDPAQLSLNRDLQVKSAEVLALLMGQLVGVTGRQDVGGAGRRDIGMRELVWRLLSGCKVQRHALLALCASMHITQRPGGAGPRREGLLEEDGGVSEENLINLGGGQAWSEQALQVELLKLLQVLMVLEKQVWMGGAGGGAPGGQVCVSPLGWEWQEAVLFQQSARSLQYVQTRPLPAQAMLVSAAARALQPCYGYTLHAHWVALISASLPYLGSSLAAISAPFTAQVCRNLDELVQQHRCPPEPVSRCSLKKENMAPDYPLTLLDGLTNITHYCLLLHTKKSLAMPYLADFQDAREALLNELPRMLVTMVMLWGVVQKEETQRSTLNSDGTLSCSRTSPTSVYFRSIKILRQKVLEFLNPLVAQFGVQVMASVGAVWGELRSWGGHNQNKILPVANEFHVTVVELIKSLSMLSTNTILQLVKEVLRTKPYQTKGDQNFLQALPMLHFTYTFIQGVPAESLQDSICPLLSLLKESVQLSLPPLGYFLLLGILNDFVNRSPNLDNKKDSRDVQEVTQRVLEVVGGVAGSSLQQTSWLSRTLEVRAQPQNLEHTHLYDSETLAEATASFYSIQALALLAEVLAPLLDVVFRSDEKEKALPLISRLLDYVFPYLKNHSIYNVPSFCTSARLLQGLSEYAYTKRVWKREAFDLYMDPHFFRMDPSCIAHWGSIIDHLMTYEKTLFKDLANMQSSALKLSPNYEQKAMLLKRQAFAMISGELDQYSLYLPLIQERVTESLRVGQAPSVMAQIFLLFRVLLLRICPQHLISLWPVMVTELIHVFVKLEKTLLEGQELSRNPSKGRGAQGTQERNGPAFLFSRSELEMYLSACKFLDATLCFPPERIPLFQMYRWAFVPEVDVDSYSGPENSIMEGEEECQPHVVRVLDGLRCRYKELNIIGELTCTEHLGFPLLPQRSISSLTQLEPFFRALSCPPKGPQSMADYVAPNSSKILSKLEEIIQNDFLENMDS
ncbi:protein dopey-2-like [Anguilla rostrata]|uniref:protein dopey-2-like n=1 Tax=Anguilla rostrata TaxID=7938 RepID=UPI0030CFF10A